MVWKYQNQLFWVKSIWKRHCIYSISWFNLLRFQLQMFKNLLFVTLWLTWHRAERIPYRPIFGVFFFWNSKSDQRWPLVVKKRFRVEFFKILYALQKCQILTRNTVKSTFELPSLYIWLKLYSNQSWKRSFCSWQNEKCLYSIIWMFIK